MTAPAQPGTATNPAPTAAPTAPATATAPNRAARRWRPTGTEILTAALLLGSVELALFLWLGMWLAALANVAVLVVGVVARHYFRRRNRHGASGPRTRSWTNRSPRSGGLPGSGRSGSSGSSSSGGGTRTGSPRGLRRMLGLKSKSGTGSGTGPGTGPLARWRQRQPKGGAGTPGTGVGSRVGTPAPGRRGRRETFAPGGGSGAPIRRGHRGESPSSPFWAAFKDGLAWEPKPEKKGKKDKKEGQEETPADVVRARRRDEQVTQVDPIELTPPDDWAEDAKPRIKTSIFDEETPTTRTKANTGGTMPGPYPFSQASEDARNAASGYHRASLQKFGEDLKSLPQVVEDFAAVLASVAKHGEEFEILHPGIKDTLNTLAKSAGTLVGISEALYPGFKALHAEEDKKTSDPRVSLAAEARADVSTFLKDN